MAACSTPNTPLQRYIVRLEKVQGDIAPIVGPYLFGVKPISQIVAVDGLTEGSQGTIELREQGKTFKIPDDVVDIAALKLQLREDKDAEGRLVRFLFDEWWVNRKNAVFNVFVDLTDRMWCHLETFAFYGCTFQERSTPSRVLGTPTLGVIDMTFLPYEVRKLNSLEILATAGGLAV